MAGRTRVFVVDARYGAVIALVAALVLAVSVGSARADDSTTFTFDQVCAGFGSNSYVVPFGITKLQITVVGQAGKGGDTSEVLATHGGGVGGSGEKVVATVSVTPGQTVYTASIQGGWPTTASAASRSFRMVRATAAPASR